MFRTFSKPKNVETDSSKESPNASNQQPDNVKEGEHANPEINKAVNYFKLICKHRKAASIDKHDFKMLICKVCVEVIVVDNVNF
jgi:hypothetical protein